MSESVKPLKFVSPKLYQFITKELEELYHIHSYDIQADAVQKENGIQVYLYFGENFSHKEEKFFSYDAIREDSSEWKNFAKAAGEVCKNVMIEDYFRIMAP